MSTKVVDLHNSESLQKLVDFIDSTTKIDDKIKRLIIDDAQILKDYTEVVPTTDDIFKIFNNLHISEADSPESMNKNIKSNELSRIIHKKFFNTSITKTKFESILMSIVFDLSQVVAGNILSAIIRLIKNFSLVCLNTSNTVYKELCFKFFTLDKEAKDIVILIINIDYRETSRQVAITERLLNAIFGRVRLSFFGAVIKTYVPSLNEELISESILKNDFLRELEQKC
jgi:hypothetical protein